MECRDFEITETLRLAEQGYTVHIDRHGVRSVRPMPWRQILNHLCTLRERFLLRVEALCMSLANRTPFMQTGSTSPRGSTG